MRRWRSSTTTTTARPGTTSCSYGSEARPRRSSDTTRASSTTRRTSSPQERQDRGTHAMLEHRYRAFLCYSHRDSDWADWLHGAIESYPIPPRLVGIATNAGIIPARLAPIFRDREELPSAANLSAKVSDALAQSANLIVICSPHAAQSRWVNEEVKAFQRLGRSDRI